MMGLAPWGKLVMLLSIGLCLGSGYYAVASSRWLRERSRAYCDSLDGPLRRMLMAPRGALILSFQVTFALVCGGAALALRTPSLVALAVLSSPAPQFVLGAMRKKRRERIDAKLDAFALALANATRATPSVGRALQMLQPSLSVPIDAEIEQVLCELRVGSSVEQTLLNFSWRVQSASLDALLSSVLIARRVGGDLPHVLETTANTLREMMRLEGVLRSKTAQARTQMWVLGCLPIGLVMAFNAIKPGYFAPMTQSSLGIGLSVIGVLFWVGALLLARKILTVEP